MEKFESCIIIGAGISGLLAAQKLKEYEIDVTLIEKGRTYGGRMASKKFGNALFDYGAQFMTTREQLFRERVERWLSKGETQPWYIGPLGNMRYVGKGGITNAPTRIGESLNVRLSERVTDIKFDKKKWEITSIKHGEKKANKLKADFLILTPPVPQSMELIDNSNIELDYDEEEELRKIEYVRCITVLAILKGPAGLPNPGAMDLNHDVLRWIGDNSAKKITDVQGAITLHSSTKFAETYWDRPDEEKIQAIMLAAKPFLKSELVEASCHRWRYSDPVKIYREKQPFRKPFFIDMEHQLGMCGDGFNGPRIEAAAMSGLELADALLRPL